MDFLKLMITHPWDTADIWLMGMSALRVFLCRYKLRRDATVGTLLFICWIYQIYETAMGTRVSAPSDVVFDAVMFVIVTSAGGNIMSVVVIDHLVSQLKSIKSHLTLRR